MIKKKRGNRMNYKIVADSSCNVLSMENPHFASVPMKVRAEKEYIDDANLDLDEILSVFKSAKPFLDYINRAIEYSREEDL